MPIFIRSLPLSLKTFWRYLILLPFLGIGAFFLSLFSVIPFVGFLVPGMVGVWLTVMGLRCALLARGYVRPIDAGAVLTVCLYFSVIFIGVGVILNAIMWVIPWALTQAGVELDPLGLFVGLFGVSPYWSGLLLAILAPIAFANAAFAVPLTAAAASTGARGWDHRAFAGFGRGAIGLSIVMAVWMFSGHLFSFFGEIWTVFGLILSVFWALAEGESLPFQTDLAPWTVLRGTLIMAWASSWYFATAVLTWEHYADLVPIHERIRTTDRMATSDAMRALRQSRMQDRSD